MSSWLGKGIREEAAAIGEAYAKMQKGGYINPGVKSKPSSDPDSNLNKGKDHPKGEAQKLNNSYEEGEDSYESQLHETSKKKMFQALIQRAKTDAEDGEKKKTASGKEKAKETARRIREKNVKERYNREDYYALADAYKKMYEPELLDEKKKSSGSDKCGDDTYWDKDEKKCKSKKKSSGGGSRIYFGGGYHHGHSGGGGTDNGGDGETDGGTDGGGDGGGGGE